MFNDLRVQFFVAERSLYLYQVGVYLLANVCSLACSKLVKFADRKQSRLGG